MNPKPYLTLTEEELIIQPSSKHPTSIKWIDIEGYNVWEVDFDKFIELLLSDEEKYRARMSSKMRKLNKLNEVMNLASFAIALGHVKRKDRRKLVQELGRRTFKEVNLLTTNDVDKKRQVNGKYFLKSYVFSLILTGVMYFLIYVPTNNDNMPFLITSFFLYPFAKIIYDVLLGFKLDYRMEKQSFISVYYIQLRFIIHLILYFVSLFLAPIGFLYLILRAIRRFIKKWRISE